MFHYQMFIGGTNMLTTLEVLLKDIHSLQERHYRGGITHDEIGMLLDRLDRDVQETIDVYERD